MDDLPARISLFLPNAETGGAERAMIRLANGMAGRGHAVDLVLGAARGGFLAEVDERVRVVDLGRPVILRCLAPLVGYLRRERPDALISAMSLPNAVALTAAMLARSRTRVIVSEQMSFVGFRELAPSRKNRLLRLAMRFLYRRAHAATAVSTALAREVAEGLGLAEGRILYAPNAIVSDSLIEQAGAASPHPWFAQELPVIVAAGRLRPEKGHALLLRAFAGMARPARLVILGEGPERPALEALARELGIADRVALPGFEANPFAFMGRAGLFVLPSRYEGLPGVLIEAMACGAPIVSTDCRTGPREILEGGRWGRLVPVGDVAALGRAMDEVLARDDHPDVRRRAADYGVAACVERYLGLIKSASPLR